MNEASWNGLVITTALNGGKFRPILFTTDMVRAILDGRKTQTRRVKFTCDPGDVLWVRETWKKSDFSLDEKILYKADDCNLWVRGWKPSLHMPREACRLYLQVESVRVERLQSITDKDCYEEGIDNESEEYSMAEGHQAAGAQIQGGSPARFAFIGLWDSLNAKRGYGWDTNPLVKVIGFRRLEA